MLNNVSITAPAGGGKRILRALDRNSATAVAGMLRAFDREAGRPRFCQGGRGEAPERALDRRLALFTMTDLGNGERFRERNRGRFACNGRKWWWCDGERWTTVGAERRLQLAVHRTVRAIQREADAIADTCADLARDLRAWGFTSEAFARMACIARLAAPYLALRQHGGGGA